MKKTFVYIIIILVFFSIGYLIYYNIRNNKKSTDNETSYNAARTETNTSVNNIDNSTSNIINPNDAYNNSINEEPNKVPTFNEISSFTTKIYDKDSARQNNIQLTCNMLNNAEVLPGATFSFTSLVR